MLELFKIQKSFGGFRALSDVTVTVPVRGRVGIVGTNGAGKSSLFAVASGQTAPDTGTVRFCNVDITRLPARRRSQSGLGRTFQVPREFKQLTVRENLLAAMPRLRGESLGATFFAWRRVRLEEQKAAAMADEWLRFLSLGAVADRLAGQLSGGQKKLLELGRVLMTNPQCILLDEPFAGVNPVLIDEIAAKIDQLNRERGIAFMVIEHHLQALKELVETLYVMDQGAVIAQGRPATVLEDPRVHAAYMGGLIQ